jgi:eukaryotic-like serine/threonine-protein kinase
VEDATQLARCPRCGAQLPADSPAELCPACRSEQARATTLTGEEPTRRGPDRASDGSAGSSLRLTPGQTFGPYRIERLLGRGGMGEVYAAEHLEHGRRIALKVLSRRLANAKDRARFLREGQLAASINHPHSVYIFGSEEIAGTPVIAMELLPGGTLRDRVIRSGPLPPAEAVDAMLQLIAGLDAAYGVGILHRDIKPSNCFVDRDGSVKVGDFGLSISALGREPSPSVSSGFEGTPQFAAPEQLRGEPLDVRADIYAVGATLYYLLTSRPPFVDRELADLRTKIATESPASPRAFASTVPQGLAAIVLRCLARDKAARPETYAELDDLLGPFSSLAPRRALLRPRFAAAAIDYMILTVCFYVSVVAVRVLGLDVWMFTIRFSLATLYFTLAEWHVGASAGKRLLGLRVHAADGGAPGIARLFARSLFFVFAWEAVNWIPNDFWLSPRAPGFRQLQERAEQLATVSLVKSIAAPFVPLTLFLFARPRNGFAGVHELISGTRVVPSSTARLRSRLVAGDRLPTPAESQATSALEVRGPFLLVTSMAPTGSFWLANDPLLKRDVWIRDLPSGADLSSTTRRDLARPARLRWLAGKRSPDGSWEAFEAPGGRALLALLGKPQPWATVRRWLTDLADELKQLDDTDRPVLGLDRVWIADDGHAKLLDFAAPGVAPVDEAAGPGDTRGSHAVQHFLRSVASSALAGRIVSPSDDPPVIRPPLSESSRAVLLALTDPRWVGVEPWLDACERSSKEPLATPRWSRAFQPALVATVCAVFILGWISILVPGYFRLSPAERRTVVASDSSVLLNGLFRIERLRWAGASEADPKRRALEVYVARRFWPLAARQEFEGSLRLFRATAIDIAHRHASVSDAEFLVALRQLGEETVDRLNQPDIVIGAVSGLFQGMAVPGSLAWLSLVLAFAFRGGLTFLLFRVVLVDDEGQPVSRARALLRAACAWSPVIAFQLAPTSAKLVLMTHPVAALTALGTIVVTMVGGACWSIFRPERGPQDLIARTWVVRK